MCGVATAIIFFNESGRLFRTHHIKNVSISYEFRLESVVDSFDLWLSGACGHTALISTKQMSDQAR